MADIFQYYFYDDDNEELFEIIINTRFLYFKIFLLRLSI